MSDQLTRAELAEIRSYAECGFWRTDDDKKIIRLSYALEDAWYRQLELEMALARSLSMIVPTKETESDYRELIRIMNDGVECCGKEQAK